MDRTKLTVSYAKVNQDEFIDHDDVYVNHTGDWDCENARFIHNTCELLLVEEGEAEYEINGARYVVRPGSVLIIGATDIHNCRILKTPYVRFGLYFMPRYLASLPVIRDYLDVFATQSPEEAQRLMDLPGGEFEELCELAQRIFREEREKADDSMQMRGALTWELAILLRRRLKKKRDSSYSHDFFSTMLEVRSFIDTHFAEDCSLKRLSGEFFIQPATISRNFSHCFNTTVSNYIMLVRISAAARLLEQTGESVTEIANQVGYNNINTFIRAFTKVMQTSPLQYRKKHNEFRRRRTHFEIEVVRPAEQTDIQ